ncbi:MAG: phosphoribosylglycinamide formyltransferase [Coriobacteriales bacterium]
MIGIGVLISGSGTNLQALIDNIEAGKLDAKIVLVVSSNESAYGLQRAEAAGIETMALRPSDYDDPDAADRKIADALLAKGADYVIMAGYMRMVGGPLLRAFPNKIVNLHPALLPSFPGAHGIADAFEHGVKVTGVTVHFANADMDAGPIIAQRAVPVLENDTLETLEARIHETEHQLYPEVVQLLAQGKVRVEGRKVRISD